MAYLKIPSFLEEDLEEIGNIKIHKINDILKINLSSNAGTILFSNGSLFKNNIRFVLNDRLVSQDSYDNILKEDDVVSLLVQITGGWYEFDESIRAAIDYVGDWKNRSKKTI